MPAPDDDYDTRFSLPGIDDPPSTEIGVILMGLDTERLLAGLGAASQDEDDPARVTLLVDQLRHGTRPDYAAAITEGIHRWRSARLAQADPPPTALRRQWTYAERVVAEGQVGTLGAAALCYLAACWLRRIDVDRYTEEHHVLPDLTP